jgi:hypothetical protein
MRFAPWIVLCATPVVAQPRPTAPLVVRPVLEFPQAGIDDTSAYRGYHTRFYRDARGNVVQIYFDARTGRVVHLLADAANESVGFTVRGSDGRPAMLSWGAVAARAGLSGASRTLDWRLTTPAPAITIGWLQLGSMRVERDLQYASRHLRPFGEAPYRLPELDSAIAELTRLPTAERRLHLAALRAPTVDAVRARLAPTIRVAVSGDSTIVSVDQPSLDGRNRLALELRLAARDAEASIDGARTISIRSRRGGPLSLGVRIITDAAPLTPLSRTEIFTRDFLAWAARQRGADSIDIERQIRAAELLSTREKLMAGLPNFATYFGRDMMMTALMMAPVWTPEMPEHVIASVLRKLGPAGDVSHEEALGGQAIREGAAEYATLLAAARRSASRGETDSLRARARALVGDLQRVRENYHMIDDELQLPLLVARWLRDPRVPDARKRAFLTTREPGAPADRRTLLLHELELVAKLAAPYSRTERATDLFGFARLDSAHWRSSSWRDSQAGYANGRFAMDVNVVWMPLALRSIGEIQAELERLGLPGLFSRTSGDLAAMEAAWRRTARHFLVRLAPEEITRRVAAKLATLPAGEQRHWRAVLARTGAERDSLEFLALSLDADGRPIAVANTDVAMRILLAEDSSAALDPSRRAGILRDVEVLLRPYPVGLFVDSLGPVVANDAYAPPAVQQRFEADLYHSPRVVWGREVNVIQLALAGAIADARDASGRPRAGVPAAYVDSLARALERVRGAVAAAGLGHAELWSYRMEGDRLVPTRYGSSSDAQLWNTTNLAVRYVLARLPR